MKTGGAIDDKRKERALRARQLDRALKKLFPNATIALAFSNPWELLVAIILSAQCTDKMVNKVTEKLFKKYQTLDAYVHANLDVFAQDIKSTGFFNSKTKNILATAKIVQEKYRGNVPCAMQELLTLPGVARKTANVFLGNACGIVEGIAVDTHVKRFSIRFDLTDHTDPVKIEQDLMVILPKKDWFAFTYRVIEYGRHIAPARTYDITQDPLIKIYPKAGKRFRV
jgi:endonuclease-3